MNFIACFLHLTLLRVIKSRWMRWAGHVGEERYLWGFGWEA
jgi:hypothetical protein